MTQQLTTHQPMFSGDLAFCSNFDDRVPFLVRDLAGSVASGEHAFNAFKTTDPDERAHVLAAPTPAEAKRRGRRVTLRPGWDAGGRVIAMQRVLQAKFSTDVNRRALLGTGDLVLVETNHWHDQFWGDCYCPRHAGVPGTNMLGELLMAFRAGLRGLH